MADIMMVAVKIQNLLLIEYQFIKRKMLLFSVDLKGLNAQRSPLGALSREDNRDQEPHLSKDNEKIRVGLSRFGDIVFDTLTRLLQEGDGQEGGRNSPVRSRRWRRKTGGCRNQLWTLKKGMESGLLKHDGKQHKWL